MDNAKILAMAAAVLACAAVMAGTLWTWSLGAILDHERRITQLEQITKKP